MADLDRDLDCQVIFVGSLIDWGHRVQHKLALLLIRRPVIKVDLDVATRENADALHSMVPA